MSRYSFDDPDGYGNPDIADELYSASNEIARLRKEIREAKQKVHWLCKRIDLSKLSDYDRKVFDVDQKWCRE